MAKRYAALSPTSMSMPVSKLTSYMASTSPAAKCTALSPSAKRKSARSARCLSVVAGGSLMIIAHSFGSASSASIPARTCMVKGGGDLGGFGGGWLEHLRQWLGAKWADLFLGVPSWPEPPGAP
eukprot:scaffold2172_cov65-Phaeocystis_antarctica.AAC.2